MRNNLEFWRQLSQETICVNCVTILRTTYNCGKQFRILREEKNQNSEYIVSINILRLKLELRDKAEL